MKRTKSKPTRRQGRNQLPSHSTEPEKLPFIAHIYELRKRLFYIGLSIGVFGGAAISVQEQLTNILLKPAGKQQFIYTTPGGGFDFAFRVCLYTGIAASIPVIVYQLIRYLQPLIKHETMRFVGWSTVCSSLLALLGIMFGYFFGLPAAMHFLLQGFSTTQIQALISIQSYMSFIMVYLLGSALLFQLPLILILINRIKPLQPRKLMKYQRWFIAGAFVLGAIISPTPDIRNQFILSGPIILMYELSIVIIWAINHRHRKSKKVVELLSKDAAAQASRLANFEKAQNTWRQALQTAGTSQTATTPQPAAVRKPAQDRPRQYAQEFSRRPYRRLGGQAPQAE